MNQIEVNWNYNNVEPLFLFSTQNVPKTNSPKVPILKIWHKTMILEHFKHQLQGLFYC